MANGISGRNLAVMASGVALGVASSRLLPPLLAQTFGDVRSRMGKDPLERLTQDHRHILSVLQQMEGTSVDELARRARLFLSLKRTFAKHAMAEEDVVYPLLHDEVRDVEQSKRLYAEHGEMKILLFEIEQALMERRSWDEQVRSLGSMVERHAREEEDVEFPKLRQALDTRRTRRLSSQVRREEALVL